MWLNVMTKNINTLNVFTFNCVYLITCCRGGLQYVEETVQFLRERVSGHKTGMKNPFPDKTVRHLTNILVFVFVKMWFT